MVRPIVELRRTPLYDRHAALGARFVPFTGWEMPVQYAGVTKEHEAVRQQAGLFDVSHMGELWLSGPQASAELNRLVTNDVGRLAPGSALYTVCCNDNGGILDDLIVYRVEPERFLVVCNASNVAKISAHFADQVGERCSLRDASEATSLIALQGPAARSVLAALQGASTLVELPRFGVMSGELAGVPLTAACTGYTGEDGFELFCDNSAAPTLWDALLQAGQPHGLQPIGLGARDTLRLEAALMLYGNDIDEETTPYEAKLGWVVKLGKGPFIGAQALSREKAQGPRRRLVGIEMRGRGIARHDYPIVNSDGEQVGRVTSGAPGLSVGKNIGLGYVPRALAKVGTPLGIQVRRKVIEAAVVKTPFYKRPG